MLLEATEAEFEPGASIGGGTGVAWTATRLKMDPSKVAIEKNFVVDSIFENAPRKTVQ